MYVYIYIYNIIILYDMYYIILCSAHAATAIARQRSRAADFYDEDFNSILVR